MAAYWRQPMLSLYTIISYQQGLEAIQFYLKQDHSLPQMQKDFIIELLAHNYFWFGGNFYLQTCGELWAQNLHPA